MYAHIHVSLSHAYFNFSKVIYHHLKYYICYILNCVRSTIYQVFQSIHNLRLPYRIIIKVIPFMLTALVLWTIKYYGLVCYLFMDRRRKIPKFIKWPPKLARSTVSFFFFSVWFLTDQFSFSFLDPTPWSTQVLAWGRYELLPLWTISLALILFF